MRGNVTAAPTGTAAVSFGMDGETGGYEFVGRAEGILPGVCGLHPYAEWYGASEAGRVPRRTHEMDKTVKKAHFCTETPLQE